MQYHWVLRPVLDTSVVVAVVRSLEDPDDELVLEAAINGQAGIMVTFNMRHLRPTKRFGLVVLTPGRLLEILKKRGFVCGEE
jgi:predicted nucleic acid-binding protein